MESVYLESSFVSYLVSNPSRDVIVAGHQQLTRDWWGIQRPRFNCHISQVVIDEISLGNPVEAQKRLSAIVSLAKLNLSEESERLTNAILACGVLPNTAVRDAAHIAVAAVHKIDYLLTWNCKHMANARILLKITRVCASLEYSVPVICTPAELLGVE